MKPPSVFQAAAFLRLPLGYTPFALAELCSTAASVPLQSLQDTSPLLHPSPLCSQRSRHLLRALPCLLGQGGRHGSGCPAYKPCHREDKNDTLFPAWLSGIVSSEVPGSFLEFPARCAISCPLLLQKHDKSIAPSLSQGYVVLEIQSVIWANPTPVPTQ